MPEFEQEDFKFPDEIEDKKVAAQADSDDISITIEDDTPPEDRNKQPMPKEIVEKLEKDELDDYDEDVKQKLKQLKKVWNDERREKERATREREEALKGDNVQQRGLKTMMGGNELNLKKDKNKAEITLELPDNLKAKKPDQYNEEEKQ